MQLTDIALLYRKFSIAVPNVSGVHCRTAVGYFDEILHKLHIIIKFLSFYLIKHYHKHLILALIAIKGFCL